MNANDKINYLEFPARDLDRARAFFSRVFGWTFVDYGPEYTAFFDAGIDGGFYRSERAVSCAAGSALVVFYSANLEDTQRRIEEAGGRISQAVFSFPGGRRFHFLDPNDNEWAVWSDLDAAENVS